MGDRETDAGAKISRVAPGSGAYLVETQGRRTDKGGAKGAPIVEEIAKERAGDLKVVKLNIDENNETAIAYNVMSIPTLMVFSHGQVAKTVIGAYPKAKLEAELEPALA